MSITPKDKLKEYFSKGAYPTEGQFADLIDSMRHHSDQVSMAEIEGLATSLNRKFDATTGNAIKATVLAHNRQIEDLEQMVANVGLRVAYFDDIMVLPDDLGDKWCGTGRPHFETYTSSVIFDKTRNRFLTKLQITNSTDVFFSKSIKFAIPDIEEADSLGEIDEDGVIPQQNTIYLCRANSKAYIAPYNSTLICIVDSIVIGETEGTAYDGAKGKKLEEEVDTAKTLAQGVSNDLDNAKLDFYENFNNITTKVQSLETKVTSSKGNFDIVRFDGMVKTAEGIQSESATSVGSTDDGVKVFFNSTTQKFYLSVWGEQAYVIYDRWDDADRFGSYNPDSTYFGREPYQGRIYYSGDKYYYYDGENLVQFLDLSVCAKGNQNDVNKWNVTADGIVDLGVVTNIETAFAQAADKSITENVKVRQIRWRTSDDNSDGGQGAGGTIFQERYGNWNISQWMMFEGPNRVCKVRTITTGGNYQVSEWQNMVLPQFLTYDLMQRMIRSVGPHAPGQEATAAQATDLIRLPLADEEYAGLMSNQDKAKLDNIDIDKLPFKVIRIAGMTLPNDCGSLIVNETDDCDTYTSGEIDCGVHLNPQNNRLYVLYRGDCIYGIDGPAQYVYTGRYKWPESTPGPYLKYADYGVRDENGFVTPYTDRVYMTKDGVFFIFDGTTVRRFCSVPSSSSIGENVTIPDNFSGKDYRIGDGAAIGKNASIGAGAKLPANFSGSGVIESLNILNERVHESPLFKFGEFPGYENSGLRFLRCIDEQHLGHILLYGSMTNTPNSPMIVTRVPRSGDNYENGNVLVFSFPKSAADIEDSVNRGIVVPEGFNVFKLLNAIKDLADIVTSGQGNDLLTEHGLTL